MKGRDGFIRECNARAAVDEALWVIVAHGLAGNAGDQGQPVPTVDAIKAKAGRKPRELSADAGYCPGDNSKVPEACDLRACIAIGGQKHPDGGEATRRGPRAEAHAATARVGRLPQPQLLPIAKRLPGPVFGQIRQAGGFRQCAQHPETGENRLKSGHCQA